MRSPAQLAGPIVAGILSPALIACGDGLDAGATCRSAAPELCGRWAWVQSVGGFAGATITPATEGFTLRVEFGEDASYRLLKGEAVVTAGRYEIADASTIFSQVPATVVRYEPAPQALLFDVQQLEFIGPDEVLLRDDCNDCFGHTFARVR